MIIVPVDRDVGNGEPVHLKPCHGMCYEAHGPLYRRISVRERQASPQLSLFEIDGNGAVTLRGERGARDAPLIGCRIPLNLLGCLQRAQGALGRIQRLDHLDHARLGLLDELVRGQPASPLEKEIGRVLAFSLGLITGQPVLGPSVGEAISCDRQLKSCVGQPPLKL